MKFGTFADDSGSNVALLPKTHEDIEKLKQLPIRDSLGVLSESPGAFIAIPRPDGWRRATTIVIHPRYFIIDVDVFVSEIERDWTRVRGVQSLSEISKFNLAKSDAACFRGKLINLKP